METLCPVPHFPPTSMSSKPTRMKKDSAKSSGSEATYRLRLVKRPERGPAVK